MSLGYVKQHLPCSYPGQTKYKIFIDDVFSYLSGVIQKNGGKTGGPPPREYGCYGGMDRITKHFDVDLPVARFVFVSGVTTGPDRRMQTAPPGLLSLYFFLTVFWRLSTWSRGMILP